MKSARSVAGVAGRAGSRSGGGDQPLLVGRSEHSLMPKGHFTQTAVLLMDRTPSEVQVFDALAPWNPRRTEAPEPEFGWFTGEPPLLLDWRPEVNGFFRVDWFPSRWPDGMGDTKVEKNLFAAWEMGFMGPFTFPGGLERAAQHAWHMEGADALVREHTAFLRISSSYVLGLRKPEPIVPNDYDALLELEALTAVAARLSYLPNVLAYFNPNGETLYAPQEFRDVLSRAKAADQPPLPAWINLRFVTFVGTDWALMDTVGMEQLDLMDHEACFPNSIDPDEAAAYLRDVCLARIYEGENIGDRHTASVPGGRHWRAHLNDQPRLEPPRNTIRWFPVEGPRPPEALLPKSAEPARSNFSFRFPWQKK